MNASISGAWQCAPTEIHRSWQDEFGTLIATLEGRTGGNSIMIIAKPEDAENTLRVLQTLPSFKGCIILGILEHFHAAPLEVLIKANQPKMVIALEPDCAGIATRGAGMTTEPETFTSRTGITYFESGIYEAWISRNLELHSNLEHPSIPASVASGLKIPCAASDFTHLPNLLERLLV